MADNTPAQIADRAAEAVRDLNHATLPGSRSEDWQRPADACSVLGSLDALAQRLAQAIGQVEGMVGELEDAGRLYSDRGEEDLPGRLVDFHGAMGGAVGQAHALRRSLAAAHAALGAVGLREE